MKILRRFYVVTKSGGVHEVNYYPRKKITKIVKIFTLDSKKSKVGNGFQLYPEGQFVAITSSMGLAKYKPDDGKRIRFLEDTWLGHYMHTSEIVALFFKKNSAIQYCKNKYEIYNIPNHKMEKSGETKEVIECIGKEHPVFTIQETLFPIEENVPF